MYILKTIDGFRLCDLLLHNSMTLHRVYFKTIFKAQNILRGLNSHRSNEIGHVQGGTHKTQVQVD